jgi:hypothetical protein
MSNTPIIISSQVKQELLVVPSYLSIEQKIIIPKCQRSLDPKHAKDIFQYIILSHGQGCEVVLGTIDVVNWQDKYFLINGRHRMEAIKEAYNCPTPVVIPIYLHIYTIQQKDDLKKIFYLRNKDLPVDDFNLDPTSTQTKKNLLNDIRTWLNNKKSNILQPKPTRRPNVNLSQFMIDLEDSDIFKTIYNLDDFIRIYSIMNNNMKVKYADKHEKKISVPMWEKCNKADIWMGLETDLANQFKQLTVEETKRDDDDTDFS